MNLHVFCTNFNLFALNVNYCTTIYASLYIEYEIYHAPVFPYFRKNCPRANKQMCGVQRDSLLLVTFSGLKGEGYTAQEERF